jgi:hypothetical protein
MGHNSSLWRWDAAMILQGPRGVKERFWGPPGSRRYFVHVIIDNPAKRIILIWVNNPNSAD